MKDKFDKTGKLPPHLVKLSKLIDKHTEIRNVIVPGLEWMADIDEGKVDERIDMTINNLDMWKREKKWNRYNKATDAGKTVFVKLLKDKKTHYIWKVATASSIKVTDLAGKKQFSIKPKDVYEVVELPHSGYKIPKGFNEGKITESGAQIAKTILQQLGGNKFIAMTGAKNLGHTNKGLQMKIGKNSKGITHVIINLKASDTYEMEFIKLRGSSRKVVKKVSGVYNDMLGKIFTKYTGLNVRL
jgi:hypothetical protein